MVENRVSMGRCLCACCWSPSVPLGLPGMESLAGPKSSVAGDWGRPWKLFDARAAPEENHHRGPSAALIRFAVKHPSVHGLASLFTASLHTPTCQSAPAAKTPQASASGQHLTR